MYTNFYAHSRAHTGTHPDTRVKLCQQKWKYGAHFQGAHLVRKEKSISDVPELIDFERRAQPAVLFCLSVSDTITPTLNQLTRRAAKAEGGDLTRVERAERQRQTGGGAACEYNNCGIIVEASFPLL